MTENEVRELEQIIDQQQERIEVLEEALAECAEIVGLIGKEITEMSASTRAQVFEHILKLMELNRQQAGGNDG